MEAYMENDCSKEALSTSRVHGNFTSWNVLSCPLENECETGNHDCKPSENCIDTVTSYACTCMDGYEMRG